MRSAHITTRRQAEGSFSVFDADVSDLQEYVATFYDTYEPSIDQLVEEIDRELAAGRRAESARRLIDLTDRQTPRRTHRRAGRAALRSLPTRVTPLTGAEAEVA
ncbi:MAG: hypothetical protein JWQ81_6501 [Amycolatopsis sp.]|uniref:hypothetical protein n=1 Tax=Amycolatopsis sp. TaxID=37632 RepID=UPI00262F1524|nr:hypothetical protein [Amycolatopsis sp.]MCU1685762.1 hypothetical protein [Amycolatopsis sp.]